MHRAREGTAAEDADAEAVTSLGERPVDVAVIIAVGGSVGLVDADRAGVDDGAGQVRIGEDAGRIAGAGGPDSACVLNVALLSMVTATPERA